MPLIQFRPEYYLYAIIFLIFDVEVIFLLPFAVAFHRSNNRSGHRHVGLFAFAGRRAGVGMAERHIDLGMTVSRNETHRALQTSNKESGMVSQWIRS